jgi:hypothetical protein
MRVRARASTSYAAVALAACTFIEACGPAKPALVAPSGTKVSAPRERLLTEAGRPSLAVLERDEGSESAFHAVVLTEDDGESAFLLGALLEARLREVGAKISVHEDSVEIAKSATGPASLARDVRAVADELLRPFDAKDPRDADALALTRERARDASLVPTFPTSPTELASRAQHDRCAGVPRARSASPMSPAPASPASLEASRQAGARLGRVAFGLVGAKGAAEAAYTALREGPTWAKAASKLAPFALLASAKPITVPRPVTPAPVDTPSALSAPGTTAASGTTPASAPSARTRAHVRIALETESAAHAAAATEALSDPRAPLARLAARDGLVLGAVSASPHPGSSCVDVTLELGDDIPSGRLTELVARAEAALRTAERTAFSTREPPSDRALAARRAAFFALDSLDSRSPLERPRDAPTPEDRERTLESRSAYFSAPGASSSPSDASLPFTFSAASAKPRETRVPVRTTVDWRPNDAPPSSSESDEAWVLVASPCAASDESSSDAGLAAVAMDAAALDAASFAPSDVRFLPWIDPRAIGLVAHGPRRPRETSREHLARLAREVASALAAPARRTARDAARARAFTHARADDTELLGVLAEALFPGRASLFLPTGTVSSLARASDEAVRARAVALAEGPLRAAVLGGTRGGPKPDDGDARAVQEALASYALGVPSSSATILAGETCRALPSKLRAANGLVESTRPASTSGRTRITLVFPDPSTRSAALLEAVSELGRETLAGSLGDRAFDIAGEVVTLGQGRAVLLRFFAKREHAHELAKLARAVLAKPTWSDETLARAEASRLREASRDPAGLVVRARLSALFEGREDAPERPATDAVPPADTKSAASALFASGGLVGIAWPLGGRAAEKATR